MSVTDDVVVLFSRDSNRTTSVVIIKNNLGEEETVLCARYGRVFAVYRAIRLRGLLLRATVCAEEKEDAEVREKAARERSRRGVG